MLLAATQCSHQQAFIAYAHAARCKYAGSSKQIRCADALFQLSIAAVSLSITHLLIKRLHVT